MLSSGDINEIAQHLRRLLSQDGDAGGEDEKNGRDNGKCGKGQREERKNDIKLNPSQLLVIAGFVVGVLDVESVLVASDQHIEIVVSGSLKRKTQLDKVMEQIGRMPFDKVVKSIIDNMT